MKNIIKVPELRFPEFSGEWERKKLLNITSRVTRRNNDSQSNHVLTISGEQGLIDQEEYFSKRVASKNLDNYYLIYKNEFAYNKSYSNGYPFGAVKRLIRYDKGVLSSLYICFEHNKNVCDYLYLEKYFESDKWHSEISKIAVEGARNHGLLNVGINDFFETKHFIPTVVEQEKIATFFSLIDKKIEKQEEKIINLEEYKKGMMQKLFPEKGEKVPELRFKGFTEPWELRKLGEVVETIGTGGSRFISGIKKTNNAPYAVLGSTSVIGYDDEYDYTGNFLLTARVGANAGNLYRYSGDVKISDNTVFFQGENLDFIFYLLEKFNLKKLSFGTGQPLIKASELNDLNLMFPKMFKEQQKIGTFFEHLDNLISLHQRRLEELKEVKKGFMQKMFV